MGKTQQKTSEKKGTDIEKIARSAETKKRRSFTFTRKDADIIINRIKELSNK